MSTISDLEKLHCQGKFFHINQNYLNENIDKFTKYVQNYEEYKNKEKYWKKQIEVIDNYDALNKEIKSFESESTHNSSLLKEDKATKKELNNRRKKSNRFLTKKISN